MKKKKSSAVERAGVNYVRSVVEQANCIFHEIETRNDFGNDAFLELVDGEDVRGICLALQIKSGPSFKTTQGYKFPADKKHFEYWAKHTLPVIGIVYDPSKTCACWINVTKRLKADPSWQAEGPYVINFKETEINRFDHDGFSNLFVPNFLNKPIVLDIERSKRLALDSSYELQSMGIDSLFNGYRNEIATWEFLINLFKSRSLNQIEPRLVYLLSLLPGHPDVFWHQGNTIDTNIRHHARELLSEFGLSEVLKTTAACRRE